MQVYEIECGGCGDEVSVRGKSTKFCYSCRILEEWGAEEIDPANTKFHEKQQDVPFKPFTTRSKSVSWKHQPVLCLCESVFWPLRKTHHSCYHCMDRRAGFRMEEEACPHCGKHNQLADGLEKTCLACVQVSYGQRRKYLEVIHKRAAKHRKVGAGGEGAPGVNPYDVFGRPPKKTPVYPGSADDPNL